MSAILVIEIKKNYPNEMDLTAYEGCDTVVEAAKLDKTMFDEGLMSLDDLIDSNDTTITVKVLGEV